MAGLASSKEVLVGGGGRHVAIDIALELALRNGDGDALALEDVQGHVGPGRDGRKARLELLALLPRLSLVLAQQEHLVRLVVLVNVLFPSCKTWLEVIL